MASPPSRSHIEPTRLDGLHSVESEKRPARPNVWALVNNAPPIEPRTTRALCLALLVTYAVIVLVRAKVALPITIGARATIVAYALLGVVYAHKFKREHTRAYTVGLAVLFPSLTLVATSVPDAQLSDIVFTGVAILASMAFVIMGRDLLVVLAALPVALVLLSLALPPQSVEVGTRAGVLAACIGLGASVAFALQIYRGLLWHAEQTIHAAYRRSLEANAAKSVFLATMSHELRTPMTGVLGTADLLAAAPSLGPDERAHVNTIRESGRALLRVIDDILDFSKVEAGALVLDPEPSDVQLEVVGAVTLMAPVAKAKGLELRIEVDCDPPTQSFDRLRFRQVLLNLISNAVKFTEQGHVRVSVTSKRRSAREFVLTCSVEDTGPGVPDEQQASMFEPFVQLNSGASRAHGGTGLGLAICARLARLMGGDIQVENAPGGGSVFRFTVVTQDAAGELGRERTGTIALPFVPVASVLVVDDQELNRQVVAAMLKQLGYASVDVVTGGAEAVEATETSPVDIVLMDMQMPGVDGIEATRRIHAREQTVPYIVALTANVLESDRERCLQAGMNDYLAKPITMETLLRTMRRAERAVRARANG